MNLVSVKSVKFARNRLVVRDHRLWIACVLLAGFASASRAQTGTVAGELYAEPPTLISLGFEWSIQGDANRNATASVSYRKLGVTQWTPGPQLLRIGGERMNDGPIQYTTPHMFSGSIFELEPGTRYECRFVLADADGTTGQTERTIAVSTRAEPMPSPGGNVYHVYPQGYQGTRQQPAFNGLLAAYFTGSSHSDNFNTFPARVQPGDTILVHAGVYKDNRFRYGGGLGTVGTGTYFLTQSGTAERPIVIKAAGDGEVIFDGDGCYNLFNVMAANYNYFEGLTIRNTELAFQGGFKNITGSVGLTVKKSRFEDIGVGVHTDWSGSKDYYIADNVFIGKNDPKQLMGWTGRSWQAFIAEKGAPPLLSEYAVKVYGSGHVVAYNRVSGFHDGIDFATYGNPDGSPNPIRERMPVSVDFYGNDISNVDDNCLEADGGAHNIRIFRNRCFNMAHRALSVQPVFGGPVYFLRNVVYHAPEGGALKFTSSSAGVLVYHNTFVAPVHPMLGAVSNQQYRNNLVLGQAETPELFSVETFTNYSSSDYNGFRPNSGAEFSFGWSSPANGVMADFPERAAQGAQTQGAAAANGRENRRYQTLAQYQVGAGQDQHSVLVDFDIFEKVTAPGKDPRTLYDPADFNFSLRPGSAAVDAGVPMAGINDRYTGRAPDLGAYEIGQPLPHYGPR